VTCIILNIRKRKSEKKTADIKTITKFNNPNDVKIKLSNGFKIDTDFDADVKKTKNNERHFLNAILMCFNLTITAYFLSINDVKQIFIFQNITWKIAQLADSINSLEYYEFVNDFITLMTCMETHMLCTNEMRLGENSIDEIIAVKFVKASFGYFSGDIVKSDSKYTNVIKNMSYTFNKGTMYYIESLNGAGKSTLLRMFTMNLSSGDVYFNDVNRKDVSFGFTSSNVYHVKQASEDTPNFSKKEIDYARERGKDEWLEEQLGLEKLFGKNTIELSGGEKKRMFTYLALISPARIILFDEVLSELSVDCHDKVASTIIEWKGRSNKIILLIGHGMIDFMTNKDVTSLGLNEIDGVTHLCLNENIATLKIKKY
jgi:ABC-type cobalamin/Fe3+-siderophores transport system ATPase subunit